MKIFNYGFYILLCVLSYDSVYAQAAVQPTKDLQCVVQCQHRFQSCKLDCLQSCPNCCEKNKQTASLGLAKYIHELKVMGGIVMRGLNSYRDPLQCRKTTCSCVDDLMTCKQGCAGLIEKILTPVSTCA